MAAAIGPVGPPPSTCAEPSPLATILFWLAICRNSDETKKPGAPPPDVSAPVRPSAVTSRGERRLARLYLCLVPLTPPSTPPHALSPAFGRAVLRVLTGARGQGQEHG